MKRLLICIRLWIWFHISVSFITLVGDFLGQLMLNSIQLLPIFRKILSYIQNLYVRCDKLLAKNSGAAQENLTSSLFVIWTVITAILIFYIERKENELYGVRHWSIVSYRLSKFERGAVIGILLFEAGLLLAANVISFPITLICSSFLLWCTVLIMFIFICFVTNKKFLKTELENIVIKESESYSHPIILDDFFSFFYKAEERDLNFLLQIMQQIFNNMEISRLTSMDSDLYIKKYELIFNLYDKLSRNLLKDVFVKNLFHQIINKMDYNTYDERKSTAELLLFPLIELKDKSCIEGLAVIENEAFQEVRDDILIDSYVFTSYLCQYDNNYEYIKVELKKKLNTNALITPQNYAKCREILNKIKKYYKKKKGTESFDEIFMYDIWCLFLKM